MPNALLQSGGNLSFPLYDARLVRRHRERFRRDEIPELSLANGLWISAGRWPARGWVLLKRSDLNRMQPYGTDFWLTLEDMKHTTETARVSSSLTFKGLSMVQARCVTRGIAADPDAIYLVELTDKRGLLWNQWFEFPTESQYNIRAPAYPQQFYQNTLAGGFLPHTWDTMIDDLWTQMASFLGTYPGVPSGLSDAPEGWSYPGTSAWLALSDLLEFNGCYVAADLTKSPPYTIVRGGDADAAFTANQAAFADFLEDDLEWISTGAGRVPGTVIVYFHRRNEFYGTEETIRRDSLQWQTTPLYSVSVASPPQFSSAVGKHYIWSDFTVRFDVDNNPLAADVATANTIAALEVSEYFDRVYHATLGSLWQLYTGVLPFVTGSQVDGVAYRQDFRPHHERQGWLTEVVRRGSGMPWPQVEVRGHGD
jgi:hypothetical protein